MQGSFSIYWLVTPLLPLDTLVHCDPGHRPIRSRSYCWFLGHCRNREILSREGRQNLVDHTWELRVRRLLVIARLLVLIKIRCFNIRLVLSLPVHLLSSFSVKRMVSSVPAGGQSQKITPHTYTSFPSTWRGLPTVLSPCSASRTLQSHSMLAGGMSLYPSLQTARGTNTTTLIDRSRKDRPMGQAMYQTFLLKTGLHVR